MLRPIKLKSNVWAFNVFLFGSLGPHSKGRLSSIIWNSELFSNNFMAFGIDFIMFIECIVASKAMVVRQ